MERLVRIICDIDELEELRPAWERWQRHPNSDLDHFLLVCRLRSPVCRPYVIVVVDEVDGPLAILAGRLENAEIAPRLGYFQPFRFRVKRLAVINQGWLGQVDGGVAEALLWSLSSAMAEGAFDVVEMFHLPEASPLLQAAVVRTPWLWRDGRPSWSTHWELTLPPETGGLLQRMSSKHRSWIRRKTRELEAAFPGCVRYRAFCPSEGLEQLCAELEHVARMTYQRGLGAGFVDDAEQRARFALFSQRQRLRAWTLHVKDVPRAYAVGILYGGTFHFAMTGYDPDFRRFELGTLMFLHMVDELCREGVAKLDFGLGDASYKQRFGDRSWREATLRLYRRSVRGALARFGAGLVESAADAGRRVASRLGAINKVRTIWRRRLTPGEKNGRDGQN